MVETAAAICCFFCFNVVVFMGGGFGDPIAVVLRFPKASGVGQTVFIFGLQMNLHCLCIFT